MVKTKYITIVKGDHKYIFFYIAGDEDKLLQRVLCYANDKDSIIDWRDVVFFIRKLRETIVEKAQNA